jgi:hypothetical protein
MGFVLFSEQTAVVSLNSVNWLVSAMEIQWGRNSVLNYYLVELEALKD